MTLSHPLLNRLKGDIMKRNSWKISFLCKKEETAIISISNVKHLHKSKT